MTLASWAFTYVLGGLTFVPLLLAAILIPAWYLLPKLDDDIRIGGPARTGGKGKEVISVKAGDSTDEAPAREGAASGTFAVLRSYHVQAAMTALNAKTGNAANTNGTIEGVPENTGESVYQSMYRSVFDRNKNTNSASPLRENEATASDHTRLGRKAVGASVFHIVLRHGHLMLYDSTAQLEVRHVISLAHHSVSLSDGEDGEPIMDAELFIKRTAIVLTPLQMQHGPLQPQSSRPKPFYLFSTLCSEKEDFYQALLSTRSVPPTPQSITPETAIKLQSTLHSSSLTPETRAFNALLGRVFLALHRTPYLETLIRTKIEKKIARVQKPALIAALAVKSIDLGDAAPILSNPRLRDLNISGELSLAFDLRYNGGVKVVISALAKLDLGPRFKIRTVELVLATSLQRMHGQMLVRIKPPPSNRIWFTFESMPEMDIKVEPVVSQRQITYTFILRAIEERIRGVIGETLVKPNWDDVPFFDTTSQVLRGGIWKDEGGGGEGDAEPRDNEPQDANSMENKHEKTMSRPVLPPDGDYDMATSSRSESIALPASLRPESQANELKRRSVAPLPGAAAMKAAALASEADRPRPLRSPSLTLPSPPLVVLDDAIPVRADDATLQPPARGWRSRPSYPPPSRRDAAEGLREMRDRGAARDAGDSLSKSPSHVPVGQTEDDGSDVESAAVLSTTLDNVSLTEMDGFDEQSLHTRAVSDAPPSLASSVFTKRTDTASTSATASSSSLTGTSQQQRGKAILAATAAATNAARNWSWNVIAKRGSPNLTRSNGLGVPSHVTVGSTSSVMPGQPIGRGQPLPPPGQPLPGPKQINKAGGGGLWPAGMGSMRRKPVGSSSVGGRPANKRVPDLPPRPTVARDPGSGGSGGSGRLAGDSFPNSSSESLPDLGGERVVSVETDERIAEDELEMFVSDEPDDFGPWRQNSGLDLDTPAASTQLQPGVDANEAAKGGRDGGAPVKEDDVALRADEDSMTVTTRKVKIPPALPARQRQAHSTLAAETSSECSEDDGINSLHQQPGAGTGVSATDEGLMSTSARADPSDITAILLQPDSHSAPADRSLANVERVPEVSGSEDDGIALPNHDTADSTEVGEGTGKAQDEKESANQDTTARRKFEHGGDIGEADFEHEHQAASRSDGGDGN